MLVEMPSRGHQMCASGDSRENIPATSGRPPPPDLARWVRGGVHRPGGRPSPRPPSPGFEDPAGSSRPPRQVGAHRNPARIHQIRAGGIFKRRQTPVPRVYLPVVLTAPGPSGSTESARLCRGCSHPPRRPLDQAASSFIPPLRRRRNGGLSPPSRNDSASRRTRRRSTRRSAPLAAYLRPGGGPPGGDGVLAALEGAVRGDLPAEAEVVQQERHPAQRV